MSDSVLALVPEYGLWLLFGLGILAAIGIPLPSTLTLMAVGAFVAAGNLDPVMSFLVALLAAVIGDQIGYYIGYFAGNTVQERLSRKPARAAQIARSKELMRKWGGMSVFLSRWLVAPVGPTINILTGASDMRWLRFALWDLAGETVWVTIYLGLGYAFRGNIVALADLMGNASWTVLAVGGASFLGYKVVKTLRNIQAKQRQM
jgi:membrane protein DedA with SNARE-associated domain